MLYWTLYLVLVHTSTTKALCLNILSVLGITFGLPIAAFFDHATDWFPHAALAPHQILVFKLLLWAFFVGEMIFGYPSTRNRLGDLGYSPSKWQRLHYRSMIRQKWSSLSPVFCYSLVIGTSALRSDPISIPKVYQYGFIVITCLGLSFRWWAMNTMGDNFELEIREDATEKRILVNEGPYRICRHPGYTGMIIYALGLIACLNNILLSILAHIALSCLLLRRIYDEELLLICEFGKQYRTFRKQETAKVLAIPWLDCAYDLYHALHTDLTAESRQS